MQAAALATARNNLNLAARELASSLEVLVQARRNQSVNRDHDDFLRVSTNFIEYLNSASFQESQQRTDSLESTFAEFYTLDYERHQQHCQAGLKRPHPSDILPPPLPCLQIAEWNTPVPSCQILPFSGQEALIPSGSLRPEMSSELLSSLAISCVSSRGVSHSSTQSRQSSASTKAIMKTHSQDKKLSSVF